jgi:hypothetical protein
VGVAVGRWAVAVGGAAADRAGRGVAVAAAGVAGSPIGVVAPGGVSPLGGEGCGSDACVVGVVTEEPALPAAGGTALLVSAARAVAAGDGSGVPGADGRPGSPTGLGEPIGVIEAAGPLGASAGGLGVIATVAAASGVAPTEPAFAPTSPGWGDATAVGVVVAIALDPDVAVAVADVRAAVEPAT